ncbi:MAG: hypothetical protein JHD13_00925 [Synechococcales cyanobacterium SupBloom_Metag_052]|jgi:hypothetical protein|nr:hypothetical protein [Synechococcales cyanobacterium SupBloom_Metag_052]
MEQSQQINSQPQHDPLAPSKQSCDAQGDPIEALLAGKARFSKSWQAS